jgi:peptide deformylase
VAALADTLRHSRETTGYGRAIAAPQIGILQRVVFLNVEGDRPWPLVNPEITARSEETVVVWDACLSFLSIFMKVRRHKYITVRYQDLAGATHVVEAGPERDLAELLQHEIDHLDGVLCIDRVEDLKTVCSKEEFELRYKTGSPYASAGVS